MQSLCVALVIVMATILLVQGDTTTTFSSSNTSNIDSSSFTSTDSSSHSMSGSVSETPSVSATWTTSSTHSSNVSESTSSTTSRSKSHSASVTRTMSASPPSASPSPTITIRHSKSTMTPSREVTTATPSSSLSPTVSNVNATSTVSSSPSASLSPTVRTYAMSASNHTPTRTLSMSPTTSRSSSRTFSLSPTATTVTPQLPRTISITISSSLTVRTPSATSSTYPSATESRTFSMEAASASHSASATTTLTPSNTTSPTVTESPDPSLSPTASLSRTPTPSESTSHTRENQTATASGTPILSTSASHSITEDGTQTLTATPSVSNSSERATDTPSMSSELSHTLTESYFLLPNVTMLFDDIWGTTLARASLTDRNPSTALDVYPAWNGASISHDSLRASAFVVYFHIREDVAHRYFAATPPMPITAVGPSIVTINRYQSAAAIGITMAAVSYNRFETRRYIIQLGPGPWIRVDAPFYFNITVGAHPSLVPTSTQDAIATASAVAAVLLFSPMGALMQSRAIIMTSIVVCQEESENNLFSILNVGVGDPDDPGYYQRGAIAGNFGIVAIVVGVLLGVSVLTTIVARPKRRETTWQRCCDILHFPSNIMVGAQLMVLPTAAASVSLMAQWGTYADISIGATGVTAVILYLSFLTYSCSSFAAVAVVPRKYPVKVLPFRQIEPIHTVCVGAQHWEGKSQRWASWKRQYYYMFAFHENRSFFLIETWAHTIVACLAGVVIGDTTYCAAHHVAIAVLSLTFLIVHIVSQPLLSLLHHTIIVFSYGLWLCAAVCACVGMLLSYGPVSTTLLDASTVANLITMCFVIVLAVPRGVYMLIIARDVVVGLWMSTEYRFPRDARKPKPYDIELLPHAQPDPIIYVPREAPKPFVPPPAPMALPPPPKRGLTVDEIRALHRRDLAAFASLDNDRRSGRNSDHNRSDNTSQTSSSTTSSDSSPRSSSTSSSSLSSVSLSGMKPSRSDTFVEVVAAPPPSTQLKLNTSAPPFSSQGHHLPLATFKSFAAGDSGSDDDPFAGFDDSPSAAAQATSSDPRMTDVLPSSAYGSSVVVPSRFDVSAAQSESAFSRLQQGANFGGSVSFGAAMHSMVSVTIPLHERDDDLL